MRLPEAPIEVASPAWEVVPRPVQALMLTSPTRSEYWLSGSSRDDLRCREDPAACRVGSDGLKQRGRQPIRRGVRGGGPALQLYALRLRRGGHTVQDRPSPAVYWIDVPQLSASVAYHPSAWQQCGHSRQGSFRALL
jgi:hypothetical protein